MKSITVEELKKRMDGGEQLHIIDVREPWEYQAFNIGAKNIPLGDLLSSESLIEDLKNEEVILHCKAGRRSFTAQQFLSSKGFSNTVNLEGGMDAWQAAFGS